MANKDLLNLQRTVDQMRATDDNERWLELNDEFPRRIYESSDRPSLCALIGNLRDASSTYLYMFISTANRKAERTMNTKGY
jgi:DNA-binding GntR family transcriptional regulator